MRVLFIYPEMLTSPRRCRLATTGARQMIRALLPGDCVDWMDEGDKIAGTYEFVILILTHSHTLCLGLEATAMQPDSSSVEP